METRTTLRHVQAFVLFLAFGLLVFVPPMFLTGVLNPAYRIAIATVFLLSTLSLLRNERLRGYLYVVFAFFILALVDFLDNFLYLNWSSFWSYGTRMDQYVFAKVLSTILAVIPIILLTKASGRSLASIYLTKGKLRLGLLTGSAAFLFFIATSVPAAEGLFGGKNLTYGHVVSWAPWIFTFVFSNGVKEELEFRGLFLRKYESLLGVNPSNLLQAIVFVLPHLDEGYSPVLLLFLAIVFFLGLAFGAVMHKTNSVLGSVLLHAGSDIPVILAVFSTF